MMPLPTVGLMLCNVDGKAKILTLAQAIGLILQILTRIGLTKQVMV